jgi:transcription initiation factor IIE alpha subunit
MNTAPVFDHIKARGQVRDAEIAKALGLSLVKVREMLPALSAAGKIFCCSVTRFQDGKRTEEILCRVSGYIPPAAPGRKSKR